MRYWLHDVLGAGFHCYFLCICFQIFVLFCFDHFKHLGAVLELGAGNLVYNLRVNKARVNIASKAKINVD